MGSSVEGICSCGYTSGELAIGGGMRNYRRLCAFPAYCEKGDHLVTVNMLRSRLRCPNWHWGTPVAYNDPSLLGAPGTGAIVTWSPDERTLELTNGSYYCPSCHKFSLRFFNSGVMWD